MEKKMLKSLGTETLKNGDRMEIKHFIPPEPEFTDAFKHFMRYADNENTRSIGSHSDGKYAECAADHYFVGMVDEVIAGQIWFGWGKHDDPVANFGQVYVDEAFRGAGVTSVIMDYFHCEFRNSPVIGCFCTCSVPWIRKLYTPYGFRPTFDGSNRLYCPGKGWPDEFKDLVADYYKPSKSLKVIYGTMEYRHEIDCLLAFTMQLNKMSFDRVFASSAVTSYQDAIFKKEDGRGELFVALNDDGHCVGWTFCLAPLPDDSTVFIDYELLPEYERFEEKLVSDTLELWRSQNAAPLFATALRDSSKADIFATVGFKRLTSLSSPLGEISLMETR
jgi:GNAT superfamily N-acetyltransferase